MFSLFETRLPVDADEFEWLLACLKWFDIEFDGIARIGAAPLVLPKDLHIPERTASGHARAAAIFEQVKALADMADCPAQLVVGARDRQSRVAPGFALTHSAARPLGTFSAGTAGYRISYNPSELGRPQSLVATFAHELAHYLEHGARTAPPGGSELAEHATDLIAVFLGFGVFMANSAKTYGQFQSAIESGWEMRAQGYLSELALVTGLALFLTLNRSDAAAAESALKDYLRASLRRALKAIRQQHPDLAASVAAIDLADWR